MESLHIIHCRSFRLNCIDRMYRMTRSGLWMMVLLMTCLATLDSALAQDKYVYELDLNKVEKDQVQVSLSPPEGLPKKAVFVMPSVIPGSYSKKDYGRFINSFSPVDKKGKKLPFKVKGKNNFYIKKAHKLAKITYNVEDTWDHADKSQWVFQPGGSNIEADSNFVINHHAFFGYFEDKKMMPFELHFEKPAEMYGSCALEKKSISATKDIFYSENYVRLVDSPLMYCEPDTVSYMVNNTRAYFSVYSPQGLVSAETVAGFCQPIADALGNFFGTLPVDEYHFIFYFPGREQKPFVDPNAMAGFGALEHSYSSLYYLPEIPQAEFLRGMIQDVAAHEFLHILTPLNVHSEEIEDFDFRDPKMSQHLWMYEGITEYFAMLIQVRDGILSTEEFIEKLEQKIASANDFPDMSFTKMSKNIIQESMQDDYLNVYQKGALIGMGLDMVLMKESKGKYGTRELMMDLAAKYGPNKPFKDDELIDEIVEMTYPAVRDFFNKYVIGPDDLDYTALLKTVGWKFVDQAITQAYDYGSFRIGFNMETNRFVFDNVEDSTLDIKDEDEILAINGKELNMENVQELAGVFMDPQDDSELKLLINRDGKEMEVKGKPKQVTKEVTNAIVPIQEPNAEQQQYLKFWLTGKSE